MITRFIENLKISTTPFSYLKAVKNLSYAQILNQIAHFDHNFMTVDAIGFKICRTTGQTKPANIAPKYRICLTRRFNMTGSFISSNIQ